MKILPLGTIFLSPWTFSFINFFQMKLRIILLAWPWGFRDREQVMGKQQVIFSPLPFSFSGKQPSFYMQWSKGSPRMDFTVPTIFANHIFRSYFHVKQDLAKPVLAKPILDLLEWIGCYDKGWAFWEIALLNHNACDAWIRQSYNYLEIWREKFVRSTF